ncbi:DUF1304 domain-containing protein [Herbiconiux sp. KACC 21604]|uniref:DUF1304 domain-containing protein n=1 Tax=unclassified Herbiconiux TaxID=2618217 RepID=UPI0014921B5D|nr:DUF1304 domain-containing protein [Herbiconiux sp. SALV-R1]QJU54826.1 DUF1304 domain-containing protein [Herbiconiux sp. SALV-R1]WPO85942.1 DUF1304 domain-containing protein [Herbiconiux sp. KACC 21604]
MGIAASILIGIAGLIHVYIFVLESIRWRAPSTWRVFGLRSQEEADTTAGLAYNQGFYNLFLAIGALLGVVLLLAGGGSAGVLGGSAGAGDSAGVVGGSAGVGGVSAAAVAGFTLALFSAGSMFAASMVLLSTGRDKLRAVTIQGLPPLLGIITLLVSLAL